MLVYSCKNFWALYASNSSASPSEGMTMVTLNQNVAPSFVTQYTVLTLYTSVIFMISAVLRMILVTRSERIPIEQNHHPD